MMREDNDDDDNESGLEMANVAHNNPNKKMNPFTMQDAYDDTFLDDEDLETAQINRDGQYSYVSSGGGGKSSRCCARRSASFRLCRCVLVMVVLITIGSYGYSIFTTTEEMAEQHEDYDSFVDGKNPNEETTTDNNNNNQHGGKLPPGSPPIMAPVSSGGGGDDGNIVPDSNTDAFVPTSDDPSSKGDSDAYYDREKEMGNYDNDEEEEEEEDEQEVTTLSPVQATIPDTSEPEVIKITLSPVVAADTTKPTEEVTTIDTTLSPILPLTIPEPMTPPTTKPTEPPLFPVEVVTLSPVQVVIPLTPEPGKEEVIPIPEHKTTVEEWLNKPLSLNDGVQFEVVGQIPHDPNAFLEGLCFVNGFLYESTGLQGKSDIRKIDSNDGTVVEKVPMRPEYFGEGLTIVNDRLIQLTYKKKQAFVYDVHHLEKTPEVFDYETATGEGWGMTYDPEKDEIILNDGMDYLIFWDANTYEEKRSVQVVRQDGTPAAQINELEFWRGRVLANVWFQDVILVINPETGVCEKEYDFSSLAYNKKSSAAVLNGISISDDPDLLYISGKLWDTIFKVKLL